MRAGGWSRWQSPNGTSVYVPEGGIRGRVLYIFPGIDGFAYGDGITRGHDWFAKILPAEMQSVGAVVIARKSSAPWPEVKADAAQGLAALGYTPGRTYALAFSAGGITLLGSALNEPWTRILLVDPSVPTSFQTALAAGRTPPGVDARIEMRFNSRNWGGFPSIQAALRPLASAVNAAGGRAEETSDYHVKFVTDGFRAMLARPRDPSLFGASGATTPQRADVVPRRRKAPRGRRVRRATWGTWALVGTGVAVLTVLLLRRG